MVKDILNKTWAFVWKRWMPDGSIVLKVKGWRTARIKRKYGNIETMSPCFWWFN